MSVKVRRIISLTLIGSVASVLAAMMIGTIIINIIEIIKGDNASLCALIFAIVMAGIFVLGISIWPDKKAREGEVKQ